MSYDIYTENVNTFFRGIFCVAVWLGVFRLLRPWLGKGI